MKHHFFVSFLLLLSLGFLTGVAELRAQGSPTRAEFHLDIHFADTASDGTQATLTGRAIGYDPLAHDNTNAYDDSTFGEVADYPGGIFNGNDFWFTRPDQTNTTVDIHHKPVTDSFAMNFSMGLSFEQYPGSIYWDPTQIPGIIKGIWLRPFYDTSNNVPPLLDMKQARIFTVPNPSQATLWGNFVLTVFYNMQPRFIAQAGVNGPIAGSAGLIAGASVYPNPVVANAALDVTLAESASLTIVGYDVAGREVLRLSRGAAGGETVIDLSRDLANAHGAIMLHIDAESGARHEAKTVMLVRE